MNKHVSLLDKIGFFKPTKKPNSNTLVIGDYKLQQRNLFLNTKLSNFCIDSVSVARPYVSSLNQNKLIIPGFKSQHNAWRKIC
ncbi:MAG: hypothetical protein PVI75_04470 [Gammaproteobacteria bacterium]